SGHVFLPRARLCSDAATRLEVDEKLVEAALPRLAAAGEVVIEGSGDEAAVYESSLHRAERTVAAGIDRLLRAGHTAPPVDVTRALAWYEQEASIALAPQQAEAVRRAVL